MRRTLIRPLALSSLVLISAIGGRAVQRATAAAEVSKVNVAAAKPNKPITLRDRLVVGLQARLKSEVAFVEAVVSKVHTGQLPQKQVDQTFFWARERAAAARDGRPHRPIVYFQPAMRARAKLLRVTL